MNVDTTPASPPVNPPITPLRPRRKRRRPSLFWLAFTALEDRSTPSVAVSTLVEAPAISQVDTLTDSAVSRSLVAELAQPLITSVSLTSTTVGPQPFSSASGNSTATASSSTTPPTTALPAWLPWPEAWPHGGDRHDRADRGSNSSASLVVPGPVASTTTASSTSDSTAAAPTPPLSDADRVNDHISLAVAQVMVSGQAEPELVFADPARNLVLVKVGTDATRVLLDDTDGLVHPSQVALSDLNGDGLPDLIVVNSGANDLLVYEGQSGGGFASTPLGGTGIAVGLDPVGVTVGPIGPAAQPGLIVSNKGSNTISLLYGQGAGSSWSLTAGPTLVAGDEPVMSAMLDVDQDGYLDIAVCDSGSNSVTVLRGTLGGQFDTAPPLVFDVGDQPSSVFFGHFDHRAEIDLVTVNTGSSDLTFIADPFSGKAVPQSYSSGGVGPDAAIAIDTGNGGTMDLVVANTDGHVALLQAGDIGMRLANVIAPPGLTSPSALAPLDTSGGASSSFYAVNAGVDAASILHFDLNTSSSYLASAIPSALGSAFNQDELSARLVSFADASLEMIAVLWNGEAADTLARVDDLANQVASSCTGQDLLATSDSGPGTPTESDPLADPDRTLAALSAVTGDVPNSLLQFVLGIPRALGTPTQLAMLGDVDAIDSGAGRPASPVVSQERRESVAIDDDLALLDQALETFSRGGAMGTEASAGPFVPPDPNGSDTGGPDMAPRLEGIDVHTPPGARAESIPLVSTALLLTYRLIFKATPPRPMAFRKGRRVRETPEIPPAGPEPTWLRL
jgi:hypothetical protein